MLTNNRVPYVSVLAVGIALGGIIAFVPAPFNALWLGGLIAVLMVGLLAKDTLLIAMFGWISIQNTVLPYLFTQNPSVPTSVWTGMLTLSEVALSGYVAIGGMSLPKRAPTGRYAWTYALVYSMTAIAFALLRRDGASAFVTLNVLRQLLIPVLFFAAGYIYVKRTQRGFGTLLSVGIIISLIGATGALVDTLLPTAFWQGLGLGNYWVSVKHLPASYVFDGLPLNMFEVYGSSTVRRAISIYGDPLAAGYSIAVGYCALVIMYYIRRKDGRSMSTLAFIMVSLLLLSGLAVTFTRAGYIIILVMVGLSIVGSRRFRRRVPRWALVAGLLTLIGLAYKVLGDTFRGANSSVLVHLHSVQSIATLLSHPLGFGVNAPGSPEGLLFWMPWTIGLIPTFAWLMWMGQLLSLTLRRKDTILTAYLLAMVSTAFISIELLGDTSMGFAWAVLGGGIALGGLDAPANRSSELLVRPGMVDAQQ